MRERMSSDPLASCVAPRLSRRRVAEPGDGPGRFVASPGLWA